MLAASHLGFPVYRERPRLRTADRAAHFSPVKPASIGTAPDWGVQKIVDFYQYGAPILCFSPSRSSMLCGAIHGGRLTFDLCGFVSYKPCVSVDAPEIINAATRFCAVFGHPIQHSASPAMHNAALSADGLNWRYIAFDVRPDQLAEAICGAKAMKLIGINLTVPHKLLAVDLMDELDESARKWGAVNTVRLEARNTDGNWLPLEEFNAVIPSGIRTHGFNTDVDGLFRSLKEDLSFASAGKSVLLLGAGGAGRAAALKLAAEGVGELYLVNRTTAKAEALADEVLKRWPDVSVKVGYPKGEVDLLLNATSLGLQPSDPSPLDGRQFAVEGAQMIYDMIYRPAETALVKSAVARGRRAVNGLGMLLYQGALAYEIWTGREAPVEIMRAALKQNIYGH